MASSEETRVQRLWIYRQCFERRQYQYAQKGLQELLSEDSTAVELYTPHLQQNLAVSKFLASSDISCVEDLLSSLVAARKSGVPLSSNAPESHVSSAEQRTVYIDFNIALVHYSLKHFAQALQYLEPMFQMASTVPPYLCIKLCFLLINTYLCIAEQECAYASVIPKAHSVLEFLEKEFSGMTRKVTKKNQSRDSAKPQQNSTGADGATVLPESTASLLETLPFPLTCPSYLKLFELLPKQTPVDPNDFKYLLHLHRAKVMLSTNAVKQAKREIKNCMSASHQNATSMFLKSNLEYLSRNYSKSIKLLNAFQSGDEDLSLPALYFNNMGCIHFQMKKFKAAEYYFFRAFKENSTFTYSDHTSTSSELSGSDLLTISARIKRPYILYNNGITQLFSGNSELAFYCFQGAASTLFKDPRLWLRLAECCVSVHAQKCCEEQSDANIKSCRAGSGGNRVFKIPQTPGELDALSETDSDMVELGKLSTEGSISLLYAERCLRSALYLCRVMISNSTSNQQSALNSYPLSSKDDIDAIRQASLANLAYVALALNNPLLAISCTKNLVPSKSNCGNVYSIFAHLYAAEAYCMLNNPGDALRHLSSAVLTDDTLKESILPASLRNFVPYTDAVRYSLLHNLTVSNILLGDFGQAQQNLNKAMMACPSSCISYMIRLQAYLELRAGKTDVALELLKRGRLPPAAIPALPGSRAMSVHHSTIPNAQSSS